MDEPRHLREVGYLYSDRKLADWVPRLTKLGERTDATHVLLNNCYRDCDQRNAVYLMALLGDEGADVAPD